MTKDTHTIIGLATTIAIIQPTTLKSLVICSATASIGSVISDIDITTSSSRKELIKIIAISLIAIIFCTFIELNFNLGILELIKSQTTILRILIGLGTFLGVCIFGIHTDHRTFMHSPLCVSILFGIIWVIFPALAVPFGISMLSHIILDLFNTKKIQLFYPIKKPKISFNLCYSNGKANKILAKIATIILTLELILFTTLQFGVLAKTIIKLF